MWPYPVPVSASYHHITNCSIISNWNVTVCSSTRTKMHMKTVGKQMVDDWILWIFGVAGLFGHWPSTNIIKHRNKSKKITMSTGDWLRQAVIIGVFMVCLWFQWMSYSLSWVLGSPIEVRLNMYCTFVYIGSAILSAIINVRNRHHLHRIILINVEFDRKVST